MPDGTRPYSTPFEAADLSGVAPALLAVGEFDPVADDVRRYRDLIGSYTDDGTDPEQDLTPAGLGQAA